MGARRRRSHRSPGWTSGNSPVEIAALDLLGRHADPVHRRRRQAGWSIATTPTEVLAGQPGLRPRDGALHAHAGCRRLVTLVITGAVDRPRRRRGPRLRRPDRGLPARRRSADRAQYEQRVRQSDFGRRFGAAAYPHLPAADLDLCAAADRFGFAMPMHRTATDWSSNRSLWPNCPPDDLRESPS